MKKRLFIIAALLAVFPTMLMAVVAKHGVVKTITLKDGTTVEATLTGDENVHYYRTADGRCLQKVGGVYEYVSGDSLQGLWKQRLQAKNEVRGERAVRAQSTAYKGSKKGLVILVNFADLAFETEHEEWEKYFNQEGYHTAGMMGSVHDYFYEQSYGAFDLTFDVLGPVTVSYDCEYYGVDEDNVPYMIKEACQMVDDEVDFADYDWDEDGYVDQVYVVYAGYSEAQGASDDTIWPHEWGLSGNPRVGSLTLDGVVIDTYACSSELHGNGVRNTGIIDGIGTACHEFSHCLGLPDFYDTSAEGTNYGMDVWSLLDYGNYNGDSYVPAAFTAYERNFSGWLDYTELSESTHVSDMPCITDKPCAYVIYNDAHTNEYYLLQNLQNTGFNSSAYGHGLLILHVDYNAIIWQANTVNNVAERQRMTIFAADNSYTSYGRNASGDPFPGTSGNTSFTDETAPASTLYSANADGALFMSKPIENIAEEDGLISFDFTCESTEDAIRAPFVSESADGAIYDLSGRLIARPQHGIYIQNGRKAVR